MEEFKKIIYCNDKLKSLYLISNYGRVFSLQKNKFLKNLDNAKGYKYVYLNNKNYTQKAYIHRLVALHFLQNKEHKPFINHKDCNPSNNNVSNLEWVTHKENMEYASNLGRFNKTEEWKEKIGKSQPSIKKVKSIDKYTGEINIFESLDSVAKYGFQPSCVCCCCKGKRKSHKNKLWFYL